MARRRIVRKGGRKFIIPRRSDKPSDYRAITTAEAKRIDAQPREYFVPKSHTGPVTKRTALLSNSRLASLRHKEIFGVAYSPGKASKIRKQTANERFYKSLTTKSRAEKARTSLVETLSLNKKIREYYMVDYGPDKGEKPPMSEIRRFKEIHDRKVNRHEIVSQKDYDFAMQFAEKHARPKDAREFLHTQWTESPPKKKRSSSSSRPPHRMAA
jgi:hypothetical protein